MRNTKATLKFFFISIYKDLTYLKWYHVIPLLLFGALCIIFSFIDFNSLIHPEWGIGLYSWKNDEDAGIEYWRRCLMSLSGAASFTGAMCVVLTTFGKISCYFWGTINCILYGLFAFAYGYGGDAQLNIMFFLPMQFWGIWTWKDNIDEENDNTVIGKSLKIWEWIIYLLLALGITVAFYYEIPKFVEAIGSSYLFYDNESARILDACTNSLSIIAQFLSLYRFWEQWIFWISVDVLQVTMYAGIAGFGIDFNILFMWCLFLTNALFGLYFWFKREKVTKKKLVYLKKLSTEDLIRNYQGKTYRNGLIIDSFYPFTKEHQTMINKAIDSCAKVYIIIYQVSEFEKPEAVLRKNWIEMIHRCDEIKLIEIDKLNNFDISTLTYFLEQNFKKFSTNWDIKEKLDILYSSEKYGRNFLNCLLGINKYAFEYQFTMLDDLKIDIKKGRVVCDKSNYLDFFHPIIRNYYIPRLVLLGPESCGKTTLAMKLAEFYKTSWVKEYGHDYCEQKLAVQPKSEIPNEERKEGVFYEWSDEDFLHISTEQSKLEDTLANEANKFLICDTDSFATNIWYERYMHKRLDKLENIHNEHYNKAACSFIYFLFSPKDVPFVQDGTRDGEKIRDWMFNLFKIRLDEQKKKFYIIEGNYLEMENKIKNKIGNLFFE